MTQNNVIQIKGMSILQANTSYPGPLFCLQNMFWRRKALDKPPNHFNALDFAIKEEC